MNVIHRPFKRRLLFIAMIALSCGHALTSSAAPRKSYCKALLRSESTANLSITPENLTAIFVGAAFTNNVEAYFALQSKKVQNEVLRILSRDNFKKIRPTEIQRALNMLREELASLGGDVNASWGSGTATMFDLLKNIPESTRKEDIFDMARGWGSVPFLYDSKVYRNEKYLLDLIQAEHDVLRTERRRDMSRDHISNWIEKVRDASGIPSLQIESFSATGSEANALVFRYAELQALRRFNPRQFGYAPAKRFAHGNVLFVGPTYFDLRNGATTLKENVNFSITNSAVVRNFKESLDPKTKTLEEEKWVLKEIEKKLQDPDSRVGALFIEPISTKEGLAYHTAHFLREIRTLCTRHQVVLFADEIMTGFGRTGELFAFQHYPGFDPDFVSFGKGFQVNGVLRIHYNESLPTVNGITTEMIPPEVLVKSTHSLNYMIENNLLDQIKSNSQYVRARVEAELKKRKEWTAAKSYFDSWFGPGYFWYNDYNPSVIHPFNYEKIESSMSRLLPALDLTKKDWDLILREAFKEM